MAASEAVSSFGTILNFDSNPVPELKSLTGPGANATMIDITHLTSDSQWKEFLAGFKDGGTVQGTTNWLSSNSVHVAIKTAFTAGTKIACSIHPSGVSGDAVGFSALVQNFELQHNVDEASTMNFTLKTTGPVTYA